MLNEKKKHHRPERLKGYDYSAPGYYFVTFNTKVRQENLLCSVVGPAPLGGPSSQVSPSVELTLAGEIVRQSIENIDKSYANANVDCYVIMPDHVHLLIHLESPNRDQKVAGPPRGAGPTDKPAGPTKMTSLPKIINAVRAISTKRLGYSIWQDRYYDHIIRNEADLQTIRGYILNNPLSWALAQTCPTPQFS